MPMRDQPEGVHRKRRGEDMPAREYDIFVDGELAGWAERLGHGDWRFYRDGIFPRKFTRAEGAYLAGVEWLAGVHRGARKTAEHAAAAAEAGEVRTAPLPPAVSDPFRGDPFADPLA